MKTRIGAVMVVFVTFFLLGCMPGTPTHNPTPMPSATIISKSTVTSSPTATVIPESTATSLLTVAPTLVPETTREPMATATVLPTETGAPPPSLAPPVSATPVPPQVSSFEVEPQWVDPGDVVTLRWQAQGDRATLCPSAYFSLFTSEDCQMVPPSGQMTFTIPLETGGFHYVNFQLSVTTQGDTSPAVAGVSVAFKCDTRWFFSDEPQAGVCPLPAIHSYAAAQRFQRGTMIWLEALGQYIILEETILYEGEDRRQVTYVRDPLEIVQDTADAVQPPPDLYAPQSGFGLVWRGDVAGSPGYRERLGWALAPEFGYEAVYQCDDARPSGGRSWQLCYLRGPEGEIFFFYPMGGWQLWGN